MIRSLTVGLPVDSMSTTGIESEASGLLAAAAETLSDEATAPRTLRFALPASGAEGELGGALLSRLRWVDRLAESSGVRWFCMPLDFVAPGPRRGRMQAALDGISRFPRLFVNLVMAADREIALGAAQDAARFVLDVSRKTNNGFDNFRVGMSCNCPANAPFFPFTRHEGESLAFSFALETTQLASGILDRCPDLKDPGSVRDRLAEGLTEPLAALHAAGERLAEQTGAEYRGLDASLAPIPVDGVSVAGLIERMIGAPVGSHGSLFATSLLTDALRTALKASGARAVGFNGVMFSLLEDPLLAAANNRRLLTLDGLLALSTVCACGVDMVPLPGVSFPEEISALVLDVAGLSTALDKPLGVRLLPIPKARVNEFTQLNLDFLCDSRVVGLSSNDRIFTSEQPLLGLRTPRGR
ncbi:MAG: DUF711 family protein [Acidobacteriota bacterium]